MKPQLFKVDTRNIDMDEKEVQRTVEGLRELGLYKMPYGELVIHMQVTISNLHNAMDAMPSQVILFVKDGKPTHLWVGRAGKNASMSAFELGQGDTARPLEISVMDILVAALATKGMEAVESKLGKHGITKKGRIEAKRYSRVTYIRPSKEFQKRDASGRVIKPHLRRGHIRRQHHGEGNKLVHKVWIEPTLVNGGEDDRDHYQL